MSTKALLTVEQFERLPESDECHELVEGELVPMPSGTLEHNLIRDKIVRSLNDFLQPRRLGVAVSEQDFQTTPANVRRPDAAFVSFSRLKPEELKRAVLPFPPTLAVEVVSASESAQELRKKIREYFASGTQTIWVVYPETREAELWEQGQSKEVRGAGAALEASCLPGFSIPIASLFELPGDGPFTDLSKS